MFQRALLAVLASVVIASPVYAYKLLAMADTETSSMPVAPSTEVTAIAEQHKVNLNTATAKELLTVEGINPSKARAIVSYRKKNGDFKSLQDLVNVKGFKRMKGVKLEAVMKQLTVE